MNRRKKVAIVTGGFLPVPPTRGGAVETLVQYLVDVNERQGIMDLVVYSTYDSCAAEMAERLRKTEFRFVHTQSPIRIADKAVHFFAEHILRREKHFSWRYIIQRLHFVLSVGHDLASKPVDVIVFENHPTLFYVLRVAGNARRYGGRYFYHLHNAISGLYGCNAEMRCAKGIIGVSEFVLRYCADRFEDFPDPSRWSILKNRIDIRSFRDDMMPGDTIRETLGIPRDAKIVLFAGRLCKEKGALELIEAFSHLKTDDAVLLILGSYYFASGMVSPYERKLQSVADALGQRVVFTGHVEHGAMGAYYALADVFVAPSIDIDAAPLSVIEPLSLGCPIVTTRVGGIPEYATDGVDSIVLNVDENLTENMAIAIDGILSGDIRLKQCKSYDLSIESFYREFAELVTR